MEEDSSSLIIIIPVLFHTLFHSFVILFFLPSGDRVVGINGRSVENLPYSVAVDLLRQIPEKVTLLVSQPVISASTDSATETPSVTPLLPSLSHSIKSDVRKVDAETSSSQSQSIPVVCQTSGRTTSSRFDSAVSRSGLSRIYPDSGLKLTSCQDSAPQSNFFSQVDSPIEACSVSQTDLSSRTGLTRSDSTYRAEVLQTDSTPVSDSTPTESTTPRAGSPTESQDNLHSIKSDKGNEQCLYTI